MLRHRALRVLSGSAPRSAHDPKVLASEGGRDEPVRLGSDRGGGRGSWDTPGGLRWDLMPSLLCRVPLDSEGLPASQEHLGKR